MILQHTLPNGLRVVIESMPSVESLAFELLIPGGILLDPEDEIGNSLILAELTSRGAGGLNSRELSHEFENRGIRHGEGASFDRFTFQATMLGPQAPEALRLVALMALEPELPESEIDPIREVLLLDLASLNDTPSRRTLVELGSRYFPAPYNRSTLGTPEGLAKVTRSSIEKAWGSRFCPDGAILSVAGRVDDPQALLSTIETRFGRWKGTAGTLPAVPPFPARNRTHIEHDSAQVQIALAAPSTPVGHDLYYASKVMTTILSGGMFGRLFIEIREKRGLVYSVFAKQSAGKHFGTLIAFAGTTPERASETVSILLKELKGLKGTVTEEELVRAKANLKASLIIGEESSAGRAVSNASDLFLVGRLRPLDEIAAAVDKVTAADIDRYLEAFPVEDSMILTLGKELGDSEVHA